MRVDGKWQEGTHIVNQSGQGEEGGQGVGALSELFWRVLGPSWGSWGGLGALLGPSWGSLGGLLGALEGLLGLSWRVSVKRWGVLPFRPPSGAIKIASWDALGPLLGRSWGRLGGLLGPSWGLLGPSWGHLEASEAHRKRNGEKAKIINCL